jgi:CRP-like cAMP-binding protein
MSKYVKLSDEEFEHFASMLVPRRLKKKERLLTAGELCWFEGFVHTGCLRVYCTDNEGADHILYFAPEDSWFTDVQSFISKKPALLNIDAVEDSEVLLLAGSSKERLYREVPKFERLFRLMTQWALVALQERLIGCMRLTAVERYRDFKNRHPALVNRIPQYQIAAYLGMSPEFLSKIRRPPPRNRFRNR